MLFLYNKFVFRLEPKHTETRSVSVVFLFVLRNPKKIFWLCFGVSDQNRNKQNFFETNRKIHIFLGKSKQSHLIVKKSVHFPNWKWKMKVINTWRSKFGITTDECHFISKFNLFVHMAFNTLRLVHFTCY